MPSSRNRKASRCRPRRKALALGLLSLALGTQAGCGREFFRNWADQDVSEAVFEKSRDPRFRMELFSIEPPALSRFGDPYDPDRPPAPPDDRAAEALSPVPQWPNHRLIIPAEGTGYLDMLDEWARTQTNDAARETVIGSPGRVGPPLIPPTVPPDSRPPLAPDLPATPMPPGDPNPGTSGASLSPTPLKRQSVALGVPPVIKMAAAPPIRRPKYDLGVRLAAYQDTGLPMPVPAQVPAAGQPGTPDQRDTQAGREAPTNSPESAKPTGPIRVEPRVPGDPNPAPGPALEPVKPRLDQTQDQYEAAEAVASEMAGILIPEAITFNEAQVAGLDPNSRPYKVSMEQSFALALINSRAYQFQLENIYTNSLAVTLQRFAFQPQFIAGLSPLTAPAGAGLAVNPGNNFLYRTVEAPGGQASALTLGQVAGIGKLFTTGGRVLASFASQTVFNFTGSKPTQPTVQSFLPISIVQPFLRGGGRAVTLEALTLAERNLLYVVRGFARFRQEFFASVIVGTPVTNQGTAVDPIQGYLVVLQELQQVEISRKNLAAYEQLYKVYKELAKGEPSGLTQLQVDQIQSQVESARQRYLNDTFVYKTSLDQFKMQLGLPPDLPLILDRSLLKGFRSVFDEIDLWFMNPRRDINDLPLFANRLPNLEDVNIDGRSVLAMVRAGEERPEQEDALLQIAVRVAFENRLDLMNARAQLYDAWRNIRFTANALQGIFNVAVTNQILTPPNTTNPFGFIDQAKQFSLVLNAELPLVRVAERNNFRTALITYQRQRRILQNAEDSIKQQVRQELRQLQLNYQNYEIARINLVLNLRQKDQAQEQIIAPPAAGGANTANAAVQTTNVISAQGGVANVEGQLVSLWLAYQTQRLSLYRDLGIMPYDEWEAYSELFPPKPAVPGGGDAPAGGGQPAGGNPPAAAAEGPPAR
ncbi:hypothetical protein EP7_002964 [Isosphaeraceae bacterium EP7]